MLSSGGSRTPSSSRKRLERRVADSPEDEDVDSEREVEVASSRTPKAKSIPSTRSHNGLEDENDENEDPALDVTPVSSNTPHGKRRRLSESGRAAATATSQQARNGANEDEDDEDDQTPPPPEHLGTASAANAADEEDEEDEDPLAAEAREEAKDRKKPIMKKQLLVRDPDDGYVMGCVVRIKCHNFLTYSDVECFPGPHLNMIFGPNGAGKSSLVAAMALGLGFPPKIMARAKHLYEYVKKGTSDGFVEIELKGRPHKKNLIIMRKFTKDSDRSDFFINNKSATKTEVAQAVKALHVNVNNLCSFLPQDRVADFAKMSGDELLKETQRAADEKLLQHQEDLSKLKSELSSVDKELTKNKSHLVDQERRMNGLERDVRRHRERQVLEEKLLIEEVCQPYVQYQEAKDIFENAKREKNRLKGRVDELNDDNAPLVVQKDLLKKHKQETEARRRTLAQKRDEISRGFRAAVDEVAKIENTVEGLRQQLTEVRNAETKRLQGITGAQRKIEDLKRALAVAPPQEASLETGQRSNELREQILRIKGEIMELSAQHDACSKAIDDANEEKKRATAQLQALGNVQRQKEEQCKREDAQLWTAVDWIRRNRTSFAGRVYDPIRLCVSVKDRRHARVAEAAINYAAMKTIVCLEHTDYARLADTFTKFKASDHPDARPADLRVNVVELPANQRDLAAYERPCTQQQLQSLGFDAFAIDLLEGPSDVLAYLCQSANLHRIPVAFSDGSNIPHERLRQPNTPFRRYITDTTITDIQFSRYGRKEPIVQDMQTRDPRLFAESVDQNKKRELELKVAEADQAKAAAQQSRDELANRDTELRTTHEALAEERAELDKEKKRIDDAKRRHAALGVDLRTAEASLARLQNQPSAETQRKNLADKMKTLSLKRVKISRSLESVSSAFIKCHTLETQPVFSQLQAVASLMALETTLASRTDEQATVIREYEEMSKRVAEYRTLAKRIWKEAEEAQTRIPPTLQEAFQERFGKVQEDNADNVTRRINDMRSELELSQNVNSSVIRRYEELKASVEKLQRGIARQESTATNAREQIDTLRAKWLPRVAQIVETVGRKFSAGMQSLGCLGEVSIKEDEDYSKYAISIKVAFRDGEALAELTPHRQSGGERSLATMMYLISLLETSKVPFSLVDEINQGMDPRAERAVHNHLVRAVCEKPDVGQYFLLTPKLLTNLHYHANIKVLCVNNGEWLPDDGLPVRKLIAKKLEAKRHGRPIRV